MQIDDEILLLLVTKEGEAGHACQECNPSKIPGAFYEVLVVSPEEPAPKVDEAQLI